MIFWTEGVEVVVDFWSPGNAVPHSKCPIHKERNYSVIAARVLCRE